MFSAVLGSVICWILSWPLSVSARLRDRHEKSYWSSNLKLVNKVNKQNAKVVKLCLEEWNIFLSSFSNSSQTTWIQLLNTTLAVYYTLFKQTVSCSVTLCFPSCLECLQGQWGGKFFAMSFISNSTWAVGAERKQDGGPVEHLRSTGRCFGSSEGYHPIGCLHSRRSIRVGGGQYSYILFPIPLILD